MSSSAGRGPSRYPADEDGNVGIAAVREAARDAGGRSRPVVVDEHDRRGQAGHERPDPQLGLAVGQWCGQGDVAAGIPVTLADIQEGDLTSGSQQAVQLVGLDSADCLQVAVFAHDRGCSLAGQRGLAGDFLVGVRNRLRSAGGSR